MQRMEAPPGRDSSAWASWREKADVAGPRFAQAHSAVLKCYQQPDPEAMRLALENRATLRTVGVLSDLDARG